MANTAGTISFDHVGIGTALSMNRLTVPVNQRDYSWEEGHVLTLFHDLSKAIEDGKSAYFLGTIVLTTPKKSDAWEVADGQQRLATSTILLASIRDYLYGRNDELLMSSIEHDFLHTIVRETRMKVPRLTLNVNDNEYFVRSVLSRPATDDRCVRPSKESHERIHSAARLAAEHVEAITKHHSDRNRVPTLNKWVRFLQESAQVILLRVPDDLNAFVMFETLNDRGLRTSQADLLKNYLFGEAGDRLAESQHKWSLMEGALESLEIEGILLTYLRHLTISLHGYTVERDVYEKIKERTTGQGPAIQFLDALESNANDYVALLNADHSKWNTYHPNIRRSVRTMLEVRATALRPLMLTISRKFSSNEAEKAFRLFIRWTVRFLIAGGGRSGTVEQSYAACALRVTKGEIKTAKDLLREMKPVIPTDKEFEAAFATARVAQNYLARYYLRALELKQKGLREPEWIPNEDAAINLEHVLPENPGSNWPQIDDETAATYYRRIGNLALLQASKNTIIGNSPFSAKKAVLQESTYQLTKQIGDQKEWGVAQITARQQQLARLAVQTWPINL